VAGALAVLAAGPAAGAAHAFFELFLGATDAAVSRGLLLGVFDPADELVAGERGDVLPRRERGRILEQRGAQIAWKRVHYAAWLDITPLARNEFICWVEDAKQQATRERRIRRTREELEEGMRRPCCWPGCKHRERNGK